MLLLDQGFGEPAEACEGQSASGGEEEKAAVGGVLPALRCHFHQKGTLAPKRYTFHEKTTCIAPFTFDVTLPPKGTHFHQKGTFIASITFDVTSTKEVHTIQRHSPSMSLPPKRCKYSVLRLSAVCRRPRVLGNTNKQTVLIQLLIKRSHGITRYCCAVRTTIWYSIVVVVCLM